MISLKRSLKNAFSALGVGITTTAELDRLRRMANRDTNRDMQFLRSLPDKHIAKTLRLFEKSTSQLWQDLFALTTLDFKTNGYFVEFGATDGVSLSNTYLLEKQFGWTGILAEPAKCWHTALSVNRTAAIDHRCVWRESHSAISFCETASAEHSTAARYRGVDMHEKTRRKSVLYEVATVSLTDLLCAHNAPAVIDYLSIDTEGSELDILSHLDWSKYRFRVITCEHNFTDAREPIRRLLESQGYSRVWQHVSEFDDWYVSQA